MSTVHHQEYLNNVYTQQVFVILVLLASACVVSSDHASIFTTFAIILKEFLYKPNLSAPPTKLHRVRKLAECVTEGTHEIVGRGIMELRVQAYKFRKLCFFLSLCFYTVKRWR